MVIGAGRDSTRQFQIPQRLIYSCLLLVVVLVAANVFLTFSYLKSKSDTRLIDQLQTENRLLADKYEEIRGEVSQISHIYGELVDKEIIIRNIFGLPEISSDERGLGIGGPSTKINPDRFSEAIRLAHSTEQDVEALLRLAKFEQVKYEEVFNTLAEKKSILDHTPSIMPARGYMSRGFGMKNDPFTGYQRFHGGIDIANRAGTPIYAAADGVIKTTGNMGDLGKLVEINHGYGYRTRYGHLSQIKVERGQKVRRGDLIGLMGSTGYSTGPHLHYEVIKNNKSVNPLEFILNF
jgi:murein DD-endopeptidase MepM/ murein hydrolase activator NlpD